VSELGDVLELLHGARYRYRTIRATILQRYDQELGLRALERFSDADHRDLIDPRELGASETVTHVWLEPPGRIREESVDGARRSLAIQDGERWWIYDEEGYVDSNEDDLRVGTSIARSAELLFNPAPLIGVLRLELLGRDTVAGRPVRLVRGVPRREARRLSTFRLDFDADEIELAVDLERGLLLRRTLRIDGGDYAVLEVRELELDATFPGDTFRPRADARRRQHVRAEELTVEEAASRASFPVWAPAALVEWELEARYYPGDKAGQEPESVHFHLWRAAGHQIHVEQTAAETVDRSSRSHAWKLLERAGERFDVIEPEDRTGNEASVRLIRDVTETTLSSRTVGLEPLVELAQRLRRNGGG